MKVRANLRFAAHWSSRAGCNWSTASITLASMSQNELRRCRGVIATQNIVNSRTAGASMQILICDHPRRTPGGSSALYQQSTEHIRNRLCPLFDHFGDAATEPHALPCALFLVRE